MKEEEAFDSSIGTFFFGFVSLAIASLFRYFAALRADSDALSTEV